MTYDWFDWMDEALAQIETIFPQCNDKVKVELAHRFRHLQEVNDDWLDEWLLLQERFRDVMERVPELSQSEVSHGEGFDWVIVNEHSESSENKASAEQKQQQESMEFWIDEQALQLFRAGQGYYHLSMFPEAMDKFYDVVDDEPDFLLGRLYLALTHFQRGEWEQAYQQLQLVLKTASHDEFRRFSHHMLGCVFVQQKQDVKAVRHFSKALKIDGENADTLFNLGACHYRLRSIRLAVPCFEQAVVQQQDDWQSMLYLARCYATLGDDDQATYWRQHAYETSQKPWIICEIADSCERQGQYDQALTWNLYCISNHPEWAEGYHGVAWNLWKKDDAPQAVVWLKKALSLKKDDPNILFSYWWIVRHVGTRNEQERVDRYMSSAMNQSPLWKLAHGNQYRIKGQLAQAKKTLTPLLEAEETRVQGAAHYQLAHLCMAEQNWKQAVKHFHEARERDEQLHETLLFEGICHFLTGDEELSKNCLRLYQTHRSNE